MLVTKWLYHSAFIFLSWNEQQKRRAKLNKLIVFTHHFILLTFCCYVPSRCKSCHYLCNHNTTVCPTIKVYKENMIQDVSNRFININKNESLCLGFSHMDLERKKKHGQGQFSLSFAFSSTVIQIGEKCL